MLKSNHSIIIPAILEYSADDLTKTLTKIAPLTDTFQIDYCDRTLTDSQTVEFAYITDLPRKYPNHKIELHLISKNILDLLNQVKSKFETIIIHAEAYKRQVALSDISILKSLGKSNQLAIALNPTSDVQNVIPVMKTVDMITIMTVEPGGQGRIFNPKALDKIATLRQAGFSGIIEVDGGINLQSIEQAVRAGGQRLVVGSALTRSDNPAYVYKDFQKLIANFY